MFFTVGAAIGGGYLCWVIVPYITGTFGKTVKFNSFRYEIVSEKQVFLGVQHGVEEGSSGLGVGGVVGFLA